MALGSTQPLREMSTRNISWGEKGGLCPGLANIPSYILKPSVLHLCMGSKTYLRMAKKVAETSRKQNM
jgi:hypothetical protein